MKIIIEKSVILPALKECKKIVPTKTTMPVFGHVAISADGRCVTFTANDGRRTISCMCECEGDAAKFTVEFDKLFKSVSSFKPGQITIESNGKETTIKQGRSKLSLATFSFASFPMPNYDDCKDSGISSTKLVEIIKKCSYAMAEKDVRPMLNGLYLGGGFAVSTDGHRLVYSNVDGLDVDGIIIPFDTVGAIPEVDGMLMYSQNQIIIKSHDLIFSSNLISAKFPEWRKVIPGGTSKKATVNKDDFIGALSQVAIGGDSFLLKSKKGSIVLVNSGAESEIDAETEIDFEIGFFAQYVIDAARAIESEKLTIEYYGANKPIIIESTNIVMPRRV